MNSNPVLEELYSIREQLLAEFGGDIGKFLEGLRHREAASGRLLGQRTDDEPRPSHPRIEPTSSAAKSAR